MARTDNFKLSSEEICQIVETSAKNGVALLKYGTLEVRFGKQTEAPPTSGEVQIAATPDKEISAQTHEQNTKDAIELDELTLREDAIAHMIVEDPVRAEEMLLDEELEDADADADDPESAESLD